MNEPVISISNTHRELSHLQLNACNLKKDVAWCEQVINTRFKLYFGEECTYSNVFDLSPPCIDDGQSGYAGFIRRHDLKYFERLVLVLALLPSVKPRILDVFLCKNELNDRPFTEFGCVEKDDCVYATGETLAFLLGGDDLENRLRIQAYLQLKEKTGVHQVLYLQRNQNDSLLMKTPLRVSEEYLHLFTTGEAYRPDLCEDFPAQFVSVDMSWDDLVLHKTVMEQLQEIQGWIQYGATLMDDWDLGKKLRPGYRALFYGPPGTGKTITACLLGKSTERDVYKVDISLIMSKFIGETEKNLEKVFSHAEDKSWILFFDEADALFSKRTQTSNANDQFANQNVSYLLQRIERFNGIVILASNFKENFDEAFFRRFESIIYFPVPTAEERLKLWQRGFSKKSRLSESIDLAFIASNYAISGASIMNVIRFVSLKALCNGRCEISLQDIKEGVRREQSANRSNQHEVEKNNFEIFS